MRIFHFVVSFSRIRSTSVVFQVRYLMLFLDSYREHRTFARQRQQEKRCGSRFTYLTLQPILSNILPSHTCCEERVSTTTKVKAVFDASASHLSMSRLMTFFQSVLRFILLWLMYYYVLDFIELH